MTPENQKAFDGLVSIFALNAQEVNLLNRYVGAVEATNININLVSRKDIHRLVSRHLFESIAIARLDDIPERGELLDLGSGAGLPGIVIAVLKPNLNVTLLDSIQKKSRFLVQVTGLLDLKNTCVVCERAESRTFIQNYQQHFDVVVARAVAALPLLWHWSAPLLKNDGRLLAQKGGCVDDELRELKRHYSVNTTNIPLSTMTEDPKFVIRVSRRLSTKRIDKQ